MSRCQTCKHGTRDWAFQPTFPFDGPTFTLPSSHYRGYPVIGVCDECKQRIEAGDQVLFTYKGRQFTYEVDTGAEVAS